MSNYCALADLQKVKTTTELAQLADLDGDNAADATVVERACTNATDLINGYISPRYTVPLTTVPNLLVTIAVRLALYYLHLDRNSLTDDINKQYDRDIEFLKRVGEGKASLGDPVNAASGEPSPGISLASDDRDFSRETMEGF
jgi:phage gp36-like protein